MLTLPLWFRLLFYVVAGIVVLMAGWRILKRRRLEKLMSQPGPELKPIEVTKPPAEPASVAPTTPDGPIAQSPEPSATAAASLEKAQPESPPETAAEEQPIPVAASPVVKPVRATSTSVPRSRPLFDSPAMMGANGAAVLPRHREVILPEDERGYVFGGITPTLAALMPESPERREKMREDLYAAGYYQPAAVENFSAIRYLAIILPLFLLGILLILVPPQFEGVVLAMLVTLPILGWALPRLYIRSQGRERLNQIERAIPDMLDMLNMCVGQGLTVTESLQRISEELRPVYPALSQELRIVNEQARLGTLSQALENFSRRVDVPEVHSFSSLLIQTEKMGTSVSMALTEYSDNMRESLRQRADEKANRASFRLLFPTVLCLMPAVFLFLMGPAIVELSDFFTGGRSEIVEESSRGVSRISQPSTASASTGAPQP